MVDGLKISELASGWIMGYSQIGERIRLKLLYLSKINQETKTGFY
jgi:hypothetical protein